MLRNAQKSFISFILIIFAKKKAPAAAVKKQTNHNYDFTLLMMISTRKKAPGAAIRTNHNRNSMVCDYFCKY